MTLETWRPADLSPSTGSLQKAKTSTRRIVGQPCPRTAEQRKGGGHMPSNIIKIIELVRKSVFIPPISSH